MVNYVIILALGRPRRKDNHEASLDYRVRFCLRKRKLERGEEREEGREMGEKERRLYILD